MGQRFYKLLLAVLCGGYANGYLMLSSDKRQRFGNVATNKLVVHKKRDR
jgi:hypothetical protein